MGTLSTRQRKKLPAGTFGLPKERAYPMPDASHARNALARAAQQVKAGNLSSAQAAQIRAKANRKLGKSTLPTGPLSSAELAARLRRGRKMLARNYRRGRGGDADMNVYGSDDLGDEDEGTREERKMGLRKAAMVKALAQAVVMNAAIIRRLEAFQKGGYAGASRKVPGSEYAADWRHGEERAAKLPEASGLPPRSTWAPSPPPPKSRLAREKMRAGAGGKKPKKVSTGEEYRSDWRHNLRKAAASLHVGHEHDFATNPADRSIGGHAAAQGRFPCTRCGMTYSNRPAGGTCRVCGGNVGSVRSMVKAARGNVTGHPVSTSLGISPGDWKKNRGPSRFQVGLSTANHPGRAPEAPNGNVTGHPISTSTGVSPKDWKKKGKSRFQVGLSTANHPGYAGPLKKAMANQERQVTLFKAHFLYGNQPAPKKGAPFTEKEAAYVKEPDTKRHWTDNPIHPNAQSFIDSMRSVHNHDLAHPNQKPMFGVGSAPSSVGTAYSRKLPKAKKQNPKEFSNRTSGSYGGIVKVRGGGTKIFDRPSV